MTITFDNILELTKKELRSSDTVFDLFDNSCKIHPHDGLCIYCRGTEEKTFCDRIFEDNSKRILHEAEEIETLYLLYNKLTEEEFTYICNNYRASYRIRIVKKLLAGMPE